MIMIDSSGPYDDVFVSSLFQQCEIFFFIISHLLRVTIIIAIVSNVF